MFNILELILKELTEKGFRISGIAHNPFRIDFEPNKEMSEEDMLLAEEIAYNLLDNEEEYRLEWENQQKRIITSEKAALLVEVLINKGIMTKEDLDSIF